MGLAARQSATVLPRDAATPLPREETAARKGPSLLFEALNRAGIRVNPTVPDPWDIEVHDLGLFCRRILSPWKNGLTELGDLYAEGVWDCADVSEFFYRCLSAGLERRFIWRLPNALQYGTDLIFNRQTRARASEDVSRHYNLGPVFETMLDPAMTYTCAYWKEGVSSLADAQLAKHDLACRKLGLQPGMEILDIGCGWSAFLKFAAERHGVRGRGVSLSSDQIALGSERCQGLPVTVELKDYRDIEGQFDRITSFGMFEHVGPKNYRTYFEKAHQLLKPGGLFLFHTFGTIIPAPTLRTPEVEWVNRHIFPGLVNPSFGQIATASDDLFIILDVQEFGPYYHPTLKAWSENFTRGWPAIADRYDPKFYRTWHYYLEICAAAFRTGKYRVWQIVFGKEYRDVYEAAR